MDAGQAFAGPFILQRRPICQLDKGNTMSQHSHPNKNAQIQSLEQLLLMSASGMEVETLLVDLPGATSEGALAMASDAEGEFEELGIDEMFLEGPDTIAEPGDELPPFLFEELNFDPAAASGVVLADSGSTEVGNGEPNEVLILEGPDGELIEVSPDDELPPFLFEEFVVDPAAASGEGLELADPTQEIEGGEPPEILVLEGPDGEIFELLPGEELPEFLFDAEFNPAASTGVVTESTGRPDGLPDDTQQIEDLGGLEILPFLPVDDAVNPIFATGAGDVTTVGPDGDVIELPDGIPVGSEEEFEDAVSGSLPPLVLESIGGFPASDADLAAASGTAGGGNSETTSDASDVSDLDFITMDQGGADALDSAVQDGLPVADALADGSEIFQSAAASGADAAASILGSELGEWIAGTVGDDTIEAGAGNDEIYASIGNNVVDGGDGEDTLVVYEGDKANYTITTQDDGVTIFEGPGLNGETVRVELTNVEQILFNDGMVRLADLASNGSSTGNTSAVVGTEAGEWIAGTSQDDDIVGGGGDDEIYAPLGTNKIDGGEGVDTLVVYEGSVADFVLSNIGNGAIYLEGPGLNGETVRSELTNVEVILFNDGAILTSSIQDLMAQ